MKTASLHSIYNFLRCSERLVTGGQPNAEEVARVAAAGYEVVINLALPDSDYALPNEAECVRKAGMQYIHIPVVWEEPRAEDFARFARAMDATRERRVFLHCAANMRVSSFLLVYRIVREGWSYAQARAELEKIWLPNTTWSTCIDALLEQAVVPARAGDEGAITELLEAAGLSVANAPDLRHTCLSFHGARAVGTISLDILGRHAVLRSLAVESEYRRQGRGRALCHYALADARDAGVSDVYTATETAADFFIALGFRVLPPTNVPAAISTHPSTAHCPAATTWLHRSVFAETGTR